MKKLFRLKLEPVDTGKDCQHFLIYISLVKGSCFTDAVSLYMIMAVPYDSALNEVGSVYGQIV